jgi:hypothetical protein
MRYVVTLPSQESHMLKTNEGTIDRFLRVTAGIVLIALVFVGPKTPWGWLGIVPLATGLLGNCPVYSLLGINTCGHKSAR